MIHDERRIGGTTGRRSKGEGPCPEARGPVWDVQEKQIKRHPEDRSPPHLRDYREVEKRKSLRIRTGVGYLLERSHELNPSGKRGTTRDFNAENATRSRSFTVVHHRQSTAKESPKPDEFMSHSSSSVGIP